MQKSTNPCRTILSNRIACLQKSVLLFALLALLTGGIYAQTENDYPAGDFWSLDGGLGYAGFAENGKAFGLIVEPKLWLSPPLMVGARAAAYMAFETQASWLNFDPSATSDAIYIEGQVFIRWNFLRLGDNINRKINIFAQGGLGLTATYRGNEVFYDDPEARRGSILLDAALGVTVPITDLWHIEAQVHGGFPHMIGASLLAGFKFPLPQKTTVQTEYIEAEPRVEYREVVKMLNIQSIEFILFGPDIGAYNLGVDRDGQALNDLVLTATAEFLNEHPEYTVRLEGNANPVTTDPNEATELMILSQYRANTVAAELEKRGVSRDQMVLAAFGGTRTVTSDRDRWDMNRRVEIIIMNAEASSTEPTE